MAETGDHGRERDFERFLTFADAVVAIAITLLVLPLVDVAGELHGQGSVTALLREHSAEIWGFFLSFAVIAQLWFAQHEVLRHVVVGDPLVTRLMVLWLLMIVALPFPTALLPEAGDQAMTKVLYIGTMAISSACLAGMSWRIGRTPQIRRGAETPDTAPAVATVAAFVAALAATLLVPSLSYWPLLLLLSTDALVRAFRSLTA